MTENLTALHAHIDTSAADCDGPLYRSYVVGISDEEVAGNFAEINFRERVLNSQVSVYACMSGTLQVSEGGFSWRETTDEGYRASDVRWCDDESCDLETYSQRDVYAEMMGY